MTTKTCAHLNTIREVTPSALGCEECLRSGDAWLHLRICRTCGHVGCCDQSPNRHATKHFHLTRHPIIEGYDPPEGWGWCYVDEAMFDLSDRKTPHNGPIPRYYWGAWRRPRGRAALRSKCGLLHALDRSAGFRFRQDRGARSGATR